MPLGHACLHGGFRRITGHDLDENDAIDPKRPFAIVKQARLVSIAKAPLKTQGVCVN